MNSIVPQLLQQSFQERENNKARAEREGNQAVAGITQGLSMIDQRDQQNQARQREQDNLNRPVEAPVQDLLNRMSAKVRNQQLPGKTAAYIFQLFQAGHITQDQALSAMEHPELTGSLPPPPPDGSTAPTSSAPLGGMSLPGPNGAPPVAIKSEVTAPSGIDPAAFAAPGTPPQRIARSPTFSGVPEAAGAPPSQSVPPPLPPQVTGGQVQQQMQQPPAQSSIPLPPPPSQPEIQPDNYTWTNRGLQQLREAGGFPQEPRKTELDYVTDSLKTLANNQTKSNIAGDKLAQDKEALKAKMSNWEANRQTAWAIAQARISAMERTSSSKFDAARDVKLLQAAKDAIKDLRDNDTKLRVSIGAMANDPGVMKQIQDNESLIKQAEEKLAESEARVKAALGETTVLPPSGQPSIPPVTPTSTTTTTRGPVNAGAPTPSEFLKSLRGRQ